MPGVEELCTTTHRGHPSAAAQLEGLKVTQEPDHAHGTHARMQVVLRELDGLKVARGREELWQPARTALRWASTRSGQQPAGGGLEQ